MIYTLSLGGFRIRCDVPCALSRTQCVEPFLVESDEYDISFSFVGVDKLDLPSSGDWVEDAFYAPGAVYYSRMRGWDPYARVRWSDSGYRHYVCEYVFGNEDLIASTLNVITLMCFEGFFLPLGGFILHSSFIRWQSEGILFSAPCGTGKSTQASLWEKYESADILNGDRALVLKRGNHWTASGMPIAGTSGIYRNESAPIKAIVVLRQAKENRLRPMPAPEALRALYPEVTIHHWDPDFVNNAVNLLLDILSTIPVYLLECLPDQGAVQLLKDTIFPRGDTV